MQYEELDLHAHTLKRPDTYVGSIHPQKSVEYIVENNTLNKKEIEYTPAVLRIFIEALSNAIDNVARSKQFDVVCKNIKIEVNRETGETTVWNDGLSIPIKHHEQANTWIPDMLFGRLLTSSNYNDDEKRVTSGRNGLGISLTNIFSKEFSIELVDPPSGKMYKQNWSQNMKNRTEPKITSSKLKKGYTRVSWIPDFEYFKLSGYTEDFFHLIQKYVFDAAMIVSRDNVSVYFNDEKLPIKTFKDYAKLYIEEGGEQKEMLSFTTDESQCIVLSSTSGYEEISFVNGIFTREGGIHVDVWSEPIFKNIAQKINTKYKTLKLTAREIKPYFKILVNCVLPNPEFATQSKHKLVAPKYNVKIELKDIQACIQWKFMEDIKNMVDAKDKLTLKKSESKRAKRIDGFDPANKAGGKDSMKCTLILCEGLSAKTYAVMGIDQGTYFNNQHLKGRDWYGIMPLRGVVMNVRNSNSASILANKEIVNIIQALGVQHGVDYSVDENFKKLRYGRIMILTDADCYTEDTSIIINRDNLIMVSTIKQLYDTFENDTVYVWDQHGWSLVKAVQKKSSTKKLVSVSTSTGHVSCTEDHTFVLVNGNQKKARELCVGDELIKTNIKVPSPRVKSRLDLNDAWLWGALFICGSHSGSHFIISSEHDVIQKISSILNVLYGVDASVENNTIIIDTSYTTFLSYLITRLYVDGYKQIPLCILNTSTEVQEAFYEGCIAANKNNTKFHIQGQVGAQGLYLILSQLHYNVQIMKLYKSDYRLTITKNTTPSTIMQIDIQDMNEQIVYDIETETHTLNAGVGDMVQHNCDGIHIQALILNLFNHLFPTLFNREGFITCMSTPIMKISHKNNHVRFYDVNSAKQYIQEHSTKALQIKYYKGLGTSSDVDVKETFGKRVIEYSIDTDTNNNMDLIFNKEHSQYRKQWLTTFDEKEIELKQSENKYKMEISDFLNRELIKFSINDCKRSIPHLMDGLKESQRKILFACIKKNLQKPIKVAQLAGYVAENTNYHHGEGCLFDTITKMAQDFVGSNNIPLLFKDGQFGTRMQPNGSDAANARYIFTKLSPITRTIIHPDDDDILTYINDDGDSIEPEYYSPIIPMVLINGANGIATGWSTNIPTFNPKIIIEWIEAWISETEYPELLPWYNGFKGSIEKETIHKYNTYGVYEKKNDKYIIRELPIGVWIDKYKEYLEDLLENKKIKSLKNYSKPDEIYFEISEFKETPVDLSLLKLKSVLNTSNMVLFDENNRIRKYDTVEDILTGFCQKRLEMYNLRKQHIQKRLEHEHSIVTNKLEFLKAVMNNTLNIHNQTEEDIYTQLKQMKYDMHDNSYDYLLSLPIKSFSQQKINQLTEKKDVLYSKIEYIKNTTPKKLWINDLQELKKLMK
jgi:DNA gyrase/topoisomerase IV subunit B